MLTKFLNRMFSPKMMSRVFDCCQTRGIVKQCNDEERHNKMWTRLEFVDTD